MQSKTLVICGPSGVGKSTLIKRLMDVYPQFEFSVSHTTRAPRMGEIEGSSYYFISRDEFLTRKESNEFIEFNQFAGNLYGTSKTEIEREKFCLLDVDVNGVKAIFNSDYNLNAKYIFVACSDLTQIESRLRSRGTEAEDKINQRVYRIKDELAFLDSQDGKNIFNLVLFNDDLETTIKTFIEFVEEKFLRN